MENYDLVYREPAATLEKSKPAPLRQAVKAMIFGLIAITVAEIPFLSIFTAPIFAIISLCMRKDYMKKYPEQLKAKGFLKAGKICAIISLPLSVISCIYWILYCVLLASSEYYFL